ncbi:Toxin HigB / Protein kinase domain of HipA [hydrothermal vent metagenome]|uniref:Toxin HigB / Protein kinase domain of HipA n=1 Tax=hydrothermal vent metagenome TaxID=652676 RepID=A0A3B0WYB9_9ZZZZ
MQNLAEVLLWGERVGALAYDTTSKFTTFEYAPEWLNKGIEIAPIKMPLSPQKYQFTSLNADTYKGLPAVFADILPDDFGNALIDAWLASKGRDSSDFNAVERLLYSGNRGMGALEFAPAMQLNIGNEPVGNLALFSLVKMTQKVLDQRGKVNMSIMPGSDDEKAMLALLQIGTSAGGARAKALIAVNADRTEIRSGQVEAPKGFAHYLLKFDGIEEHKTNSEIFGDPKGFGRMEYAYYLMANDAKINMSSSELLIEGERAHFMTKRFDRVGNKKRHVLSLCAMDHADYKQPGTYSYEQLLAVARKLRLPRKDAIEIYRRMVFNIMARNHDDHTKNTSFIYDAIENQWRLSPAFDLAYSYKKDSPWVNSHQMSANGKRDNFNRDDLLKVGTLIGNFKKESNQIIEQMKQVVCEWQTYAKTAGVFELLTNEIQKNILLKW